MKKHPSELIYNSQNFRFVRIEPHTRHDGTITQRFILEEWCPDAGKYVRCLWCHPLVSFNNKDYGEVEDELSKIANATRNTPRVIIYGTYNETYSANSTEEIGKVCVHLVKSANEDGFFDYPTKEPENPNIDIDSIKNPVLKKHALGIIENYNAELKYWKETREEVKLLEKALSGDYVSAYQLCSDFEDFELRKVAKL